MTSPSNIAAQLSTSLLWLSGRARLDYQPLFREMSQRSLPKSLLGEDTRTRVSGGNRAYGRAFELVIGRTRKFDSCIFFKYPQVTKARLSSRFVRPRSSAQITAGSLVDPANCIFHQSKSRMPAKYKMQLPRVLRHGQTTWTSDPAVRWEEDVNRTAKTAGNRACESPAPLKKYHLQYMKC